MKVNGVDRRTVEHTRWVVSFQLLFRPSFEFSPRAAENLQPSNFLVALEYIFQ